MDNIMNARVTSITGIDDAIISMYMSKRNFTEKLESEIREVCDDVLDRRGFIKENCNKANLDKFNEWLNKVLKIGRRHITILRYINIGMTVTGIHRAGQDDIDAHAKRFDNRFIRSSTRLANFENGEMSEFYIGKIIPTNEALDFLGVHTPNTFVRDGKTYVKSVNGYIQEEYIDDKDVRRGLYMLSIPSNFVAQINLCEWGHVFKERNKNGGANPEVKKFAEMITSNISEMFPQITRDYILSIQN